MIYQPRRRSGRGATYEHASPEVACPYSRCYDSRQIWKSADQRPHRVNMSRTSRALIGAAAVFSASLLRVQTAPGIGAKALQSTGTSASTSTSASTINNVTASRAMLDRYCVSCHSERLKTAGLVLETAKVDVENVAQDPALWEKVVRKVRSQAMPPPGARRPHKTEYAPFTRSLEAALDRAASGHPNPGRPNAHRLNRAEYANAVRD